MLRWHQWQFGNAPSEKNRLVEVVLPVQEVPQQRKVKGEVGLKRRKMALQ